MSEETKRAVEESELPEADLEQAAGGAGGVNVAMADGSVRFLRDSISPSVAAPVGETANKK